MVDMFTKGYAEEDKLHLLKGKVLLIPHHLIYHPRKEKMSMALYCSAVYGGHSLNEHLISGPDLINTLTVIICHFCI